MSEEGSFGLNLFEKFMGLLIFVTGCITAYYTFTSTVALGNFTGFYGFLSLVLVLLGLLLITAKTE